MVLYISSSAFQREDNMVIGHIGAYLGAAEVSWPQIEPVPLKLWQVRCRKLGSLESRTSSVMVLDGWTEEVSKIFGVSSEDLAYRIRSLTGSTSVIIKFGPDKGELVKQCSAANRATINHPRVYFTVEPR